MKSSHTGRIRVLIVIRHPVGGIRTYLKYTYRHLDPNKYKLTILTVRDTEGELIKTDLSQFDIEYIAVDSKHAVPLMVWRVFNILRIEKYDIIHSQGFTAGIVSVLGNLISKTPHLITSHDVFQEEQFSGIAGSVKRWLMGGLFGKADFIQSVSEDAQSNLLEFLPVLQRYEAKRGVIMNGIDIERFEQNVYQPIKESFHKQLNIKEGSVLFGFLGRFMPQKGFEYLVDAVAMLARAGVRRNFRIIAVNDGAYIREYKRLIEEKNVSQYFTFTGFVPDVGSILLDLDALVMPSLWEAYGLMAAEAFIVGCPVIASNCIGLREVIRDTPAIVVQARDSDSLARALRDVMEKSHFHKQRALDFVPEARKRFDSRVTAKQLDILLNQVIAFKKSG